MQSFDPSQKDFPGHDKLLTVKMNSVQFRYEHQIVMEVKTFFVFIFFFGSCWRWSGWSPPRSHLLPPSVFFS